MQTEQELRFGPYRLDCQREQLWRGKQSVKLTPKALAVLRQLVQQSGQVVSKEELFQTVWADTVVSDAALTFCIQELRRALRDDAKEPRYIETVHRRGFRFIGKVVGRQQEESQKANGKNQKAKVSTLQSLTPSPQHPVPLLIGRGHELAQLHAWLDKALQGERQIAFVTGEPGIGKTALVEAFRQRLETGDWRLVLCQS
jgi:DNA-binding winged helix-turn-helix (wHTH) protein